MAGIPAVTAHTTGSSSIINRLIALANGIWTRLGISAGVSMTSGNYRSLLPGAVIAGENFGTVTYSGDCITGLSGVYEVSAAVQVTGSGTGQTIAGIAVNPGANTWNSASAPPGSITELPTDKETDGYTTALTPSVKVRLISTDLLMWYGMQDSGGTLTLAVNAARTFISIAKVAE